MSVLPDFLKRVANMSVPHFSVLRTFPENVSVRAQTPKTPRANGNVRSHPSYQSSTTFLTSRDLGIQIVPKLVPKFMNRPGPIMPSLCGFTLNVYNRRTDVLIFTF